MLSVACLYGPVHHKVCYQIVGLDVVDVDAVLDLWDGVQILHIALQVGVLVDKLLVALQAQKQGRDSATNGRQYMLPRQQEMCVPFGGDRRCFHSAAAHAATRSCSNTQLHSTDMNG